MPRPTRSLSLPIILGSVTVPLAIAMLVGWILVLARTDLAATGASSTTWLVLGSVSLATIVTALVLLSVFLIKEILEVRRQNTFIDSVTHELKSPLASLKLCLETLERPTLAAEQQARLRRMMRDDVERLTAFIDDVLEANRVAHGRTGLSLTQVGLRDLAIRCSERVRRRYQAPEGAIRIDVPPAMTLVTDETAMEMIVKNLLDNTVKYSDGPPDVLLTIRTSEQGVALTVRDQGIGMQRQHVLRVLERFYRAPTEEVRQRKGTGLGLFVVHTLVRSLGGRLQVDSPGLGEGTLVSVTFPHESRDASSLVPAPTT